MAAAARARWDVDAVDVVIVATKNTEPMRLILSDQLRAHHERHGGLVFTSESADREKT